LKLGKRMILKCLLEVKKLFKFDDHKPALNLLYIDHYCLYIQKLSKHRLTPFIEELNAISIKKSDLGWNLEELEREATELLHDMT